MGIRMRVLALLSLALVVLAVPAQAQKKYGPGASDTEIKIGQTMPYSGPASAYGTIGKASAAYFHMVNEQGGINGRKINFISLDDGYSPPRTVEQTRKLIEEDQVLFLFGSLGTPTNSAIHKYVNAKGVPHVFVNTGATKWGDPKNFPWTIGWNLSYQNEAHIYAKYILDTKPSAKIAVLYQNDDYGKDYLKGLKDGLGDKAAKLIIAEASYEVTDTTIDSQIVSLQASGADTFVDITTPKFAAQAIRKVYDIGWKPLHIINNVSASVGAVLTPAGLDKSIGMITASFYKDPVDPQWKSDPAMQEYMAWMKKYYPDGNAADVFNLVGYVQAEVMARVLKQCGDNLSRENVMKQVTSIKGLQPSLLLPGVTLDTSADDYFLIQQAQLSRFDGKEWKLFGKIIGR
jgi:branched-chain amino acid transport system substrate-binding protein